MKLSTLKTIKGAIYLASLILLSSCSNEQEARLFKANYQSSWETINDGHYLGAELWANPIQDWRIKDTQLQCDVSGGERNVFLLTKQFADDTTHFNMDIKVRALATFLKSPSAGYVGFRLGVKGEFNDYRDSAVHGRGMKVGVDHQGYLFIGNFSGEQITLNEQAFRLNLSGELIDSKYALTLTAFDSNNRQIAQLTRQDIDPSNITGGTGLVCHAGDNSTREGTPYKKGQTKRQGNIAFAFSDWSISANTLLEDDTRKFGPIAFSLYTLDKNTLKMTAQMLPLPDDANNSVTLEMQLPGSTDWSLVASSEIIADSRTGHFRINDWQFDQAVPFRIGYKMRSKSDEIEQFYYSGKISKEPKAGSKLKVASLSCHLDLGFPHQDMVSYIDAHKSDFVIFTGDQYYESNAGYGTQKAPLAGATLDYLRKWYQFGWSFRDIYRDVPSVFLVDDHDVYHGNIWGDEGKAASGKPGADIQDSGGYKMPAKWVNAVQRSMTAHMPDPVDPTPVQQDISVYYTDLNYAGVSFAILEDRKWKTSPRKVLTKAQINNGFSRNLEWDAKVSGDAPGLNLLGERQMNFLEAWSQDWSGDTRMKSVISQTLFSAVQTRPKKDIVTFKDRGMRPVPAGEYPEQDITVQDFDTNGWPQTPRKNALKIMRKAFAYHIAGDTHLGVTFQYGIDGWNNGAWAIGSPAISNVWPRRWFPKDLPLNHQQGQARNLGEYYDGFGNEITVKAVANPTEIKIEPIRINERAPGYNILTFDTSKQTLEIEAWPRWVNPKSADAQQFSGWPLTYHQTDNGYPLNGPQLPLINNLPKDGAVIQLLNESTNEIEYTLRVMDNSISPKAFSAGLYTVRVFDKNMVLMQEIKNQKAEQFNALNL